MSPAFGGGIKVVPRKKSALENKRLFFGAGFCLPGNIQQRRRDNDKSRFVRIRFGLAHAAGQTYGTNCFPARGVGLGGWSGAEMGADVENDAVQPAQNRLPAGSPEVFECMVLASVVLGLPHPSR